MDIFESLSGVISCMLMIGLGYFLTHRGWFDEQTGVLFSRLAMCIAIPLYMIVSMLRTYSKADLLQAGLAIAIPLASMLVVYGIGLATSFLVHVPAHRVGVFRAMFFVANSGFIGFPVNVALFGEKALPYAVIWYLVQSFLFWTIGAWGLSTDGWAFARMDGGSTVARLMPSVFSLANLRNVLSPPLIGSVVAVILILAGIRLPVFLESTFTYLGGLTTPLAMLFLGIAVYFSNLRSLRIGTDIWVLVAARFLVAPAVVIVLTSLVPVPDLMRKVFIIESAMPVMMQVSIAARAFNADAKYAAVTTALTTVMAMATIPAYFLLLHYGIV
ncbi:AEC family transporter [Xanthobacteraceae bacterium Astr-EGSB]|uniref:AEC family transporter n=1 Tax=Astrobacterium formosum TaxID=3069710 RepID=UPI0027AF1486|nr:AEC family transporter [Xanthobacteraceae bacterium Astr-EGSB]